MIEKDKVLQEIHTLQRRFHGERIDYEYSPQTGQFHHKDYFADGYPYTRELENGDIGYYQEDGKRVVLERNVEVIDEIECEEIATLVLALIRRVTPDKDKSEYYKNARSSYEQFKESPIKQLKKIIAVLEALRAGVEDDHLESVAKLIHAEVFNDYLEMAEHLLSEGYKDPAAVIIGSTLENHIKKLCIKYEVPTDAKSDKAKIKSIKLDTLNAELVKAGAYDKTDFKDVTAWYGRRSSAAHGKYKEYTSEQVRLMLDGVRDFIVRLPA